MKILLILLCALVSSTWAAEPLSKLVAEGRFPQVDLLTAFQKRLGPGMKCELTGAEYRAYRTSFGVFALRVDYPPGDPDYVICDGLLIGIQPDRFSELPPLRVPVACTVRGVPLLARRSAVEERFGPPRNERSAIYAGRTCARLEYFPAKEGICLSFYVMKDRVWAISITVEE